MLRGIVSIFVFSEGDFFGMFFGDALVGRPVDSTPRASQDFATISAQTYISSDIHIANFGGPLGWVEVWVWLKVGTGKILHIGENYVVRN